MPSSCNSACQRCLVTMGCPFGRRRGLSVRRRRRGPEGRRKAAGALSAVISPETAMGVYGVPEEVLTTGRCSPGGSTSRTCLWRCCSSGSAGRTDHPPAYQGSLADHHREDRAPPARLAAGGARPAGPAPLPTGTGAVAVVADPQTGEAVGGFSGAQHLPLIIFRVAPGESGRVPLLIGTASFTPRLGYTAHPGSVSSRPGPGHPLGSRPRQQPREVVANSRTRMAR